MNIEEINTPNINAKFVADETTVAPQPKPKRKRARVPSYKESILHSRRRTIKKWYEAGLSSRDISHQLNSRLGMIVSHTTINKWIKKQPWYNA
jgi:IS30 family transposase